jgi:hypothetical protein
MKRIATPLISAALLSVTGFAYATPDDACMALSEARSHLVAMVDATDKGAQDDLKGKVHAASAKLDETLAAMSKGPDAAKAAEFKAVWEEFKKTRESEIIPHVYAGKKAEAKAIASGVQAERMKKMKGTMGCK